MEQSALLDSVASISAENLTFGTVMNTTLGVSVIQEPYRNVTI